jgi:hypothetical protein
VLSYVFFRGYVIPPPHIRNSRASYLDAGASSWSEGNGGPSLSYFFEMWKRHGTTFDEIDACEKSTTEESFYKDAPVYHMDRIRYKQRAASSSPEQDSDKTPFLPFFIRQHADDNDYIFFKLDIDSPMIEGGNIDYIFNQSTSIDEIAWEQHIRYNGLMRPEWGPPSVALRESYECFLPMRQQGIRGYSRILSKIRTHASYNESTKRGWSIRCAV